MRIRYMDTTSPQYITSHGHGPVHYTVTIPCCPAWDAETYADELADELWEHVFDSPVIRLRELEQLHAIARELVVADDDMAREGQLDVDEERCLVGHDEIVHVLHVTLTRGESLTECRQRISDASYYAADMGDHVVPLRPGQLDTRVVLSLLRSDPPAVVRDACEEYMSVYEGLHRPSVRGYRPPRHTDIVHRWMDGYGHTMLVCTECEAALDRQGYHPRSVAGDTYHTHVGTETGAAGAACQLAEGDER